MKSPVAQVNGTTLTGGTWKVELHRRLWCSRIIRALQPIRGQWSSTAPTRSFLAIEHLLANTGNLTITNGHIMQGAGGSQSSQLRHRVE